MSEQATITSFRKAFHLDDLGDAAKYNSAFANVPDAKLRDFVDQYTKANHYPDSQSSAALLAYWRTRDDNDVLGKALRTAFDAATADPKATSADNEWVWKQDAAINHYIESNATESLNSPASKAIRLAGNAFDYVKHAKTDKAGWDNRIAAEERIATPSVPPAPSPPRPAPSITAGDASSHAVTLVSSLLGSEAAGVSADDKATANTAFAKMSELPAVQVAFNGLPDPSSTDPAAYENRLTEVINSLRQSGCLRDANCASFLEGLRGLANLHISETRKNALQKMIALVSAETPAATPVRPADDGSGQPIRGPSSTAATLPARTPIPPEADKAIPPTDQTGFDRDNGDVNGRKYEGFQEPHFDLDSHFLDAKYAPAIRNQIPALLKELAAGNDIYLTGHADTRRPPNVTVVDGSDSYNDNLSLERAEYIKGLLLSGGIGQEYASRIHTSGAGTRELEEHTEDQTSNPMNRSVTIETAPSAPSPEVAPRPEAGAGPPGNYYNYGAPAPSGPSPQYLAGGVGGVIVASTVGLSLWGRGRYDPLHPERREPCREPWGPGIERGHFSGPLHHNEDIHGRPLNPHEGNGREARGGPRGGNREGWRGNPDTAGQHSAGGGSGGHFLNISGGAGIGRFGAGFGFHGGGRR